MNEEQPTGVKRVTVSLIPQALWALRRLCNTTKMSQTDVVNRALSLYDFINTEIEAGHKVGIIDEDGNLETIKLL